MAGTLIFLGCFLWFAMAFNGGIGPELVNYAAFTSGLCIIATGLAMIFRWNRKLVRVLAVVAVTCYSAVIWNRIQLGIKDDWFGYVFDAVIVLFILAALIDSFIVRPEKQPGNA
jgi:hypothetical protein